MNQIPVNNRPFFSALGVHARVLFAIMIRETKTRYGRMRLGYLWALVEPMLFVGIFFAFFYMLGRPEVSGMPLLPFLITGASTFVLFRDAMTTGMTALTGNNDLTIARGLLEMATHFTAALLLILATARFSGPVQVENMLGATFWFFCAGLLGLGGGMGFGALATLFPSVQQLVQVILGRPLFFISRLFFTTEMVPEEVLDLALLNPLLNITELVRSEFFKEFDSQHASRQYVMLFVLASLFLGMVTQLGLRRRILSIP
jgi:capsular polysaccharide transport system permease protein